MVPEHCEGARARRRNGTRDTHKAQRIFIKILALNGIKVSLKYNVQAPNLYIFNNIKQRPLGTSFNDHNKTKNWDKKETERTLQQNRNQNHHPKKDHF